MRDTHFFPSVSAVLSLCLLANAQWNNPWISGPPPDSAALDYVTVMSESNNQGGTIRALESCPTDNAIAVLSYNGTAIPTLSPPSCNTKFSVTIPSGSTDTYIVLTNPLDYETNFTIFCTVNLKGEPAPRSLLVQVVDVNDNYPYFDPSTPNVLSFLENKLGLVYTFRAIDKDELGQGNLTFTLDVKQGSADKFRLDTVLPNTANLIVVNELDREKENFYLLEIVVTDKGGYSATKQVALNVDDERDSPPVWVKTEPLVKINEELPQGDEIFRVEARDGDTFNDPISYSIEDPRGAFTIDPVSGQVKVASKIDSDVTDFNPYFDLIIIATVDRQQDSQSTQTNTTVFVGDLNDNVPRFNSKEYDMSVAEDFVGRLTAYEIKVYDPDMGAGGTYQVKVKDSGNIADYVKITPSDGKGRNDSTFNLVIDQSGLLDFENENGAQREVALELEVVELLDTTHTDTCRVTIHAQDVNDNDPVLSVEGGDEFYIYEKSSETYDNLTVANFTATDKDSGNYGTVKFRLARYNLEGKEEFDIDPDTGRLYVKNSSLLDYDGPAKSFKFYVEAYDNNPIDTTSEVRNDELLITINLKDVNDNAPILQPHTGPLATVLETAAKDSPVATIQAEDKDQPGTDNSRLNYSLRSQRRIEGQEACPYSDTFFRIDNENNKGSVKVDVATLTDCYGTYEIVVQANDFGDALFGVQSSENVTYQISVKDVNNNAPEFKYPAKEGSTVYVYETTITGKPLTDTNNTQIRLKATDLDYESNGLVHFRCDDKDFAPTFEITEISGANEAVITVKSELNRTIASYYDFNIIAFDEGVPQALSSSARLKIYVRFEKKQKPYFKQQNEEIAFFENMEDTKLFQKAIDPDNITLYPGEEPYDLCYFIVCGNAKDFRVGGDDKKKNEIYTSGTLDRENPPEILYVIVEASDSCDRNPIDPGLYSCTGIDLTRTYFLNASITIQDVKDCPPEFTESLYGGATFGDKKGDEVLRVMTIDPDENDSATCIIKNNNITASDPSLPTNVPFTVESPNKILLGFDVQDNMKGYFTFEVTCTDTNSNSNTAEAQIFILDTRHKVNVVFEDPAKEVEAKRSTIERIFTETYGYECNVEKITANLPDADYEISTTVVTHFIDAEKSEPVLASDVERLKLNTSLNRRLYAEFEAAELTLIRIGSIKEEANVTAQIFLILFIIASIVIVGLLIYGFFLITDTLELKRKVKALSTTKFGSSESVNNRLGVTVPNTNVFAEGSNPIFQSNVNGESHFAPRGSDSSGDSVLVGVEDNPEFSGYKPKSNLSQGTWDLSKAVDDPVPRPSLMYATPVRNPLAGLVIDEEEEGVTNFGTDSEDERDPSHAGMFIHAGNEGRPPPVYPPPPPPDMTSQLKKRKAPPPPVDDYDNYAYGSDTEL